MLKGSNVVLSQFHPDDKAMLFEWINDADSARYNAPYRPVDWHSHSQWFDSIGRDPCRILFAIRKASDRALIGTIQLMDIHPVHRSAELLVRLGKEENRGQGFGTEAIRLVMEFGWRDLNLERIWLRVFASNERAIRAYKAAGMTEEGRMRRAAFIAGRWEDQIIMAALRADAEASPTPRIRGDFRA
jgi:RimJ/RimL family protein N-acetyltransferase